MSRGVIVVVRVEPVRPRRQTAAGRGEHLIGKSVVLYTFGLMTRVDIKLLEELAEVIARIDVPFVNSRHGA